MGDAVQGKALIGCSKAIRKAGTKLTSTRLAQLQRCLGVLTTCVQLKPEDPECLTKARATCDKGAAAIAKTEAAVPATLAKACAESTAPFANVLAPTGLGYDGERSPCAAYGVDLGSLTGLGTCLTREHACAAERIVAFQYPRAAELLGLIGYSSAATFPCLYTLADGGGVGVDPTQAGAVAKCQKTIRKAATSYMKGRISATSRCSTTVLSCLQVKPGDQACLTKAGATCAAAFVKLPALVAKLRATITASCGAAVLDIADVLAPEGLGFGDATGPCALRGVSTLDDDVAIAECIRVQHACQADQLLEVEMPRFRELLGLGSVTLP